MQNEVNFCRLYVYLYLEWNAFRSVMTLGRIQAARGVKTKGFVRIANSIARTVGICRAILAKCFQTNAHFSIGFVFDACVPFIFAFFALL